MTHENSLAAGAVPLVSDGAGIADPNGRADRLLRVPWVAVAVFVILSLGLAWLIAIPLWIMGPEAPAFPIMLPLLASAMMFTPTLAVLVVMFPMRVPARERLRFLGMWPLRPAKRVVWFTVAAMFGPPVIVVVSVAVAAAFGWVTLDLVNFSAFSETLLATLPEGTEAALPPIGLLVLIQILSIPFGALINSFLAVGEEIGWRGWLLPALRPLGVWPALILSGALWGLWHSPLILLGYNFGLTDWRGVALMTAGCIAWGVLLGWSRLRSGCIWPAVVGHGALNASAGMFMMLAAAGAPIDLALVNPLSAAGWIAIAPVVLVLLLTGQFRKEPQLAAGKLPSVPYAQPETPAGLPPEAQPEATPVIPPEAQPEHPHE